MDYVVIEIQKSNGGLATTIVNVYNNLPQAEQKYHTILSAAAVSTVDVHGASMLNQYGRCLKNEYYIHQEESEVE